MTYRSSPISVLVGMLLVSLLITSCGGAGALTAEDVHTQYIQALSTRQILHLVQALLLMITLTCCSCYKLAHA